MATGKKAVRPSGTLAKPRKPTNISSLHSGRVTRARTYRSPAFAAIHEGMADLHSIGLLDAKTMREFDIECLTPLIDLTPAAIRRIREKAAISQSVFALHLNVTTGVVSKWERGEKQPRGPAAKLLTLAAKNGIAAIA